MYFVRIFNSGNPTDVRSKKWAEYMCDACGEESHVEVRYGVDINNYYGVKKCPKCFSFGKKDKVKELINKKNILESEKEKIQKEIEQIIKELDQVESISN